MRVRHAILTAVAAFGVGCPSTWNCRPDSEDFEVDEDLTEQDIDDIMLQRDVSDPDDIDCEAACDFAYNATRGWVVSAADTCTLTLNEDNTGHVECAGEGIEYWCKGRRPLGHVEDPAPGAALDAQLVACARLEAASVVAFVQLARQLRRWGAPEALVARCMAAARDEVAHTRLFAALVGRDARDFAAMQQIDVRPDLFEAALHNAVEGCAGETWAALSAHWTAAHATDPALRAAHLQIARDEADHAQLAWDLHAWFVAQLSPAQRARVDAARDEALARLTETARAEAMGAHPAFALPAPAEAARLGARFAEALAA
ncbi:MAG: ferritin-like domain-containing protein [Alphaproteobacteria bacterium]|nr:ferritin-like domain-containing protein [Alphaproteobacteria bacterium]